MKTDDYGSEQKETFRGKKLLVLDRILPGGSLNEDRMIFWTLLCLSVVGALLRPNAWPLLFVQERMKESGEAQLDEIGAKIVEDCLNS